ncbi:SGNH/GDSL hydrolase family protein [Polaromonas sp.]|uniref:SGNH/GDSL hydrolase family protein n=1 Tax=Polaromonas sp. TaxID=1869339 RepID=UPI003263B22E
MSKSRYLISLLLSLLAIYAGCASAQDSRPGESAPKMDSVTSLRCFYYTDKTGGSVATSYEWGLAPGTNEYFVLHGYWENGGFGVGNMFYTDTKQSVLRDVCTSTLVAKGRWKWPTGFFAAANGVASWNYTIWTNEPSQQPYGKPTELITFGDSLSDTGILFAATDWGVPNRDAWFLGHFSNGLVWSEYLSRMTALPMHSWAVGGAQVSGGGTRPLGDQMASWSRYMSKAKNYQIQNTQFLIWLGANDIMAERSPSSVAEEVVIGVRTLLAAGAKRIVVLNLPDISRAPMYQKGMRSGGAKVRVLVDEFNAKLKTDLGAIQLGLSTGQDVRLIDVFALFNEVLDNPLKHGFTETYNSCLEVLVDSAAAYGLNWPKRPTCRDVNGVGFVFWDLVHPTTQIHQLIATAVWNQIRQASGEVQALPAGSDYLVRPVGKPTEN